MGVIRLSNVTAGILDAVRASMGRAAEQGQRDIPIDDCGLPTVDIAIFELCIFYMRHRERRRHAAARLRARGATCSAPTTTSDGPGMSAIPPDSATSPSSIAERRALYDRAVQRIGSPAGPPSPGTADPEKSAGTMPARA